MISQENPSDKELKRQLLIKQMKPIIIDSLVKSFPNNNNIKNNIEAIYDLLGERKPFSLDNAIRNIGSAFLYEATNDIKSCKLLYSKRIYHHAIYHLQQAVEKAVKGYVLLEGYYTITELKELFTHDTPLILLKAVLIKTGIKKMAENSTDPLLLKTITIAENAVKNEGERFIIASFSKEKIHNFLSQTDDYQKITQLIRQLTSQGFANIGTNPMPISFFYAVSAIVVIMILGIITFPHESFTRYPGGIMTPDNYNKQLGIVTEAPKMIHLLESQMKNLFNYYSSGK
ncbi:MAG: HEPN domain-containing protein [Dehalococcoidales bacterium]